MIQANSNNARCACYQQPASDCKCSTSQDEDLRLIKKALASALPWLKQAYCLVEANSWEGNQEMQWPIDLADAVHYCAEALSELDPDNEDEKHDSHN